MLAQMDADGVQWCLPIPDATPMVIHASKNFATRLRCQISQPDHRHIQRGRADCWSADILRAYGVGDCALMMNDASLSMVVIPLKGVKTLEKFLEIFLPQAARLFTEAGGSLEIRNQTVIVLRRSDRQLIGSMNDARLHARDEIIGQRLERESVDWDLLEDLLNEIPFSATDYVPPKIELVRVLASGLY